MTRYNRWMNERMYALCGKQAGVDPGVTDLPWPPGVVEIVG